MKKKKLVDVLFEEAHLLFEEEEEEGGDDIFGGDEDSDSEADKEESESSDSGDEDADDSEKDTEDADEKDEEKEEEADDDKEEKPSGPADDTIDGEVNNLLSDFESEAVASAESVAALGESKPVYTHSMSKLLFEADDSGIDISHFANNVARVINNYQTLLDVEKMIFQKAKAFLSAKYGDSAAKEFEDILASDHELTFVTGAGSDSSKTSEELVPIATGAMTPSG